MKWRFWRRRRCPDAAAAAVSATASHARAERDYASARGLRDDAAQVVSTLRAHNIANRYDDWLREVVRR